MDTQSDAGIEALIAQAVDYLFTNGCGEVAERLVLSLPDGRDGGGWSRAAVQDRLRALLAPLAPFTDAPPCAVCDGPCRAEAPLPEDVAVRLSALIAEYGVTDPGDCAPLALYLAAHGVGVAPLPGDVEALLAEVAEVTHGGTREADNYGLVNRLAAALRTLAAQHATHGGHDG